MTVPGVSWDPAGPPEDPAALGVTATQLIAMYRTMARARVLDRKIWALNQEGRATFVVSSQGHEAAQVGSAWVVRKGTDLVVPNYRGLGVVLALGMTSYEVLLNAFGRAADPNSGGRQLPAHWGSRRLGIISGSSRPGTQLPHAVGLGLATALGRTGSVVFCYLGADDAEQGDFHESLGVAGARRLPVVFICERSSSDTARPADVAAADLPTLADAHGVAASAVEARDALAVHAATWDAAERARRGGGPTLLDCRIVRAESGSATPAPHDDPLLRLRLYLAEHAVLPATELDQIDADVVSEVDQAVGQAEAAVEPDPAGVLTHLWARPLPPGRPSPPVPAGVERTLVEALRQVHCELLEADERVMILGNGVGARGGIFRVTEGLYQRFGPERVMDMPSPESALVGVAIGLALGGMRPIAELQVADSIYAAAQQLINEAARMSYRSGGDYCVPLVVRAPWGGGVHGGLYHSQAVEAAFAHVPGLKVVAPATPADVVGLLREAIDDPDPVLFLEHKRSYRLVRGPVPNGDWRVPIGVADIAREGTDCTIVTYGMHRHVALDAATRLDAEDSISVEVIDLRTISPLDATTVLASAAKTGRVLIVHEDNLSFGVGAEVAAVVATEAFYDLDAPLRRLAMADVPAMPFAPSLEQAVTIDSAAVIAAVRALCEL